jgi:signal transduction histidine kinase
VGFAELLYRPHRSFSDEQRKVFTAAIDDAAKQMSRLVEDLLDLSRIERGQFSLVISEVDLAPVLRLLAGEFRLIAPNHQITASIPESLPAVRADQGRVKQIVGNLLSNAVRYSPPGARISLVAEPEASCVRISVKDTGIGIPPDEVDRIFEKFFRGTNAAVAPTRGVGLGLALVRQLVEAQHGDVGVSSIQGQGSTFWVSLPRVDAVSCAPWETQAPPARAGSLRD